MHHLMSNDHRSSTTKKSYLRSTRQSVAEAKDRQANVKDSLLKFLDDCDTEDLIMGAVVSPRKRGSTPLSLSDHRGIGPASPHANKSNNRRSRNSTTSLLKSSSSARHMRGSDHGTSPSKWTPPKAPDEDDSLEGSDTLANDDDDSSVSVSPPSSPISSPRRRLSKAPPRTRSSSLGRGRDIRAPRRTQSLKESSRRRPSSTRSSPQKSNSLRDSNHRSPRVSSRKSREPRRTKSEAGVGSSLDRKLSRAPSRSASRRRAAAATRGDDDCSVGSTRSSFSTMSTISRTSSAPALDAGPLNAFFNTDSSSRGRRDGSGASVASAGPGDEKFLERRKSRQDEILDVAMKERVKYRARTPEKTRMDGSSADDDEDMEDDDYDQPMVREKSKNPFKQIQRGLSKTAKTTKSAAKGSVNVVKNPKRAAKNVGSFAKDVGKETVKMALDPKLAAKTGGSLAKKGVGKTFKITKNVTTGVAKGSVGLTKTVAKTGIKTTTKVAGTVVDGAGKVVKVFKHDKDEQDEEFDDYHARNMDSRRKTSVSLLDRLENAGDGDEQSEGLSSQKSKSPSNSLAASSVLIPTGGRSYGSSWDV